LKIQTVNRWLHRAQNLGLSSRVIVTLVLLSIVTTATEILGLGIFLPIFQFIRLEGDINALISDSTLWEYIINAFSVINVRPSLAILLILSFGFFLFRQAFTYFRLVYVAAVKQRIIQKQRNRIFNKYMEADIEYHDSVPIGNLVNVITTEVSGAIIGIMAPMDLIVYLVMIFGYFFILFMLSWHMTLIAIIVLLLASKVPNIWIKKSAHTGRSLVVANTMMSEFLIGRFRSPRLVRLSGTETMEKNEFQRLTRAQRKYTVYASILRAKTDIVLEPVVIGLSMIFLYFSYTVLHFQIEVIGLYLVIALRLLPTVKSILTQWQKVQQTLGSIEIIENRLKSMRNAAEQDIGIKSLGQLKQSIMINNVSYRYLAENDSALKNINIEFKANTMTAIVGPSGSGKSTLIDLLPRLRVPEKGRICIDGVDIEVYSLKSLRELISYVPQSPQIFGGTIKEHILYGKLDVTKQEVEEAIHLAGAEDFINQMPQGIDTILGEDAVKLSGGQRQRVDLARVLVKKAPVLILDEPTSNLDAKSEDFFMQSLRKIRKNTNTSIIIITHRLPSIFDADRIVVLNQGEVEECGNHLELLDQNGWYAKTWEMQFKG
jgi:ABC-type multidrug transport system fused ATPase/permease subunit